MFFSMGSLGRFFWCMDFFKFRNFLCMDFFNPKIFFWCMEKIYLRFFSPKNGTHHITSYDAIWWGGTIIWWGGAIIWCLFPIIWWVGPSYSIIWCHMMGHYFSDFFGNCCSHFQISKVFVAAACFRQWERPWKSKKNHVKGKGPGKGLSPAKGRPEKGTPKTMKSFKRPASSLDLANKNDPGLSLEEKMENFSKKTNGNTQEFLDSLSAGQRESLWGRFSRARKALHDTNLNSLWDKHCKGEGSDQHKKKLLAIYLKNKGDLKKGNAFAKELVEISEATGILVAIYCCLQSLATSLFLSQLRLQGDIRMGTIQCHPYKIWPEGGHAKSTFGCIFWRH